MSRPIFSQYPTPFATSGSPIVLCSRLLRVSSTRVDRLLRLAFTEFEYVHYFIESTHFFSVRVV